MKFLKYILLTVVLLGFTGCETTNFPLTLKTTAEKQIEDLKAQFAVRENEIKDLISSQKDSVIQSQFEQMQAAAGSLYGADLAFNQYLEPNRLNIIIQNRIKEADAALGVEPTAKAIKEENERLKKELDETLTSLDDLQKEHNKKIDENSKLVAATEQFKIDLKKIEEQYKKEKEEFINKLLKKQEELNELNNQIIALEKQRADDAKAIQAFKLKVSLTAGGLALAALAGAIWSPFFKRQFCIFAGICGFISVAIFYIKAWMIIIVFALIIVLIVGWIVLSHKKINEEYKKERDIATDTYRSLQRIKEKSKSVWDTTIKPELDEGNLKYVEKNKEIIKEKDKSRNLFIDKRLAEVGDK